MTTVGVPNCIGAALTRPLCHCSRSTLFPAQGPGLLRCVARGQLSPFHTPCTGCSARGARVAPVVAQHGPCPRKAPRNHPLCWPAPAMHTTTPLRLVARVLNLFLWALAQEDALLKALILKHGARNWSIIAHGIRGRSGKSCRLRWCNQLNPCVKKEPFSEEEDAKIIAVRNTPWILEQRWRPTNNTPGSLPQAHKEHGNKWAIIARSLTGRHAVAIVAWIAFACHPLTITLVPVPSERTIRSRTTGTPDIA